MGLRSRQRLAGVAHEDSFDVEISKHRTQSLDEHLQASRRDVDDFHLAWKHAVGVAGLLLALYELALMYQALMVPKHAPPSIAVCVLLKLLALASLRSTRQCVLTGTAASVAASVISTAAYALLWLGAALLLSLAFSLAQVSPIAIVYFVVSHAALRLIGGNTQAEVARAEQLEKLERIFNDDK